MELPAHFDPQVGGQNVDSFSAMAIPNPYGSPFECWRLPGPMFVWIELVPTSYTNYRDTFRKGTRYMVLEYLVDSPSISFDGLVFLLTKRCARIPDDLVRLVWLRAHHVLPVLCLHRTNQLATQEELDRAVLTTGYSALGALAARLYSMDSWYSIPSTSPRVAL